MTWWVHSAYESGGIVLVFSWAFWAIFSICLHELAHGWAAIANGDDTPRRAGHMTIDPLVHMGWMSLLFFAVAGIAWGLMPTDRSRYRNRRLGRVTVAAAGPAMNLALAAVTLALAAGWAWACETGRIAPAAQTAENVERFLFIGGFLNLVLCAFNMLPVPPLDGSEVLSGLSPALDRFFSTPAVRMYGLLVVLFIFWSSVDAPLQRGAARAAVHYVDWVGSLLPAADAGG